MSATKQDYRSIRLNPWWIPPFMGGVPEGLSAAHLQVLGFMTLAMFFENYDLCQLGNSLPQIAKSFGLDDVQLGWFTTLTRLGALPAFLLLMLADRIGRRLLLLLSVSCMSFGSLATALAQSAPQFLIAQIVTRSFIVAAAVTSFVVISEELPAANRGWGIGILAGVGAIGFGAGTLVYGFVGSLPFGWRSLYAVGLVPVLFLPAFTLRFSETVLFTATRVEAGSRLSWAAALRPLVGMLRHHPRRALATALIGAFSNAGIGPSFQFISHFLQTERDWTPGLFATFSIAFGAVAIIGNPIAGRLSDRYGRRIVAAVVLVLFPAATTAFYLGPKWLVGLPWTLMVLLAMVSNVCVRLLATEIFPTAYRGTGAGTLALLETAGVSAGLLAYTVLVGALGSQAVAITLVAFACLGAAASVFLVPETAQRELE
jgi:putative MFS transporter